MSRKSIPDRFDEKREQFADLDTIWLDGEFLAWDDANVHVLSHGIHYGTSVFEGVRCYDTADGTALFRWEDHLDRFYESAAAYGMEIPFERSDLTAATKTLIRRQDLDACYVRPVAFYGYDRLSISPRHPTTVPVTVAIACWPWGPYLGEDALESGIDVAVSSWRKYAGDAIPPTAKTGGAYVNGVLATDEARRDGYDEAIVVNDDGNVAEGPGENLFLVRDGEVFTPALAEGALDGVTRRSVIELAREVGYTVHDNASLSRGELYTADELFFTGTAAEVTPIRSVDGIEIGDGTRGPVTEDVQARLFAVLEGEAEDRREWFTPV